MLIRVVCRHDLRADKCPRNLNSKFQWLRLCQVGNHEPSSPSYADADIRKAVNKDNGCPGLESCPHIHGLTQTCRNIFSQDKCKYFLDLVDSCGHAHNCEEERMRSWQTCEDHDHGAPPRPMPRDPKERKSALKRHVKNYMAGHLNPGGLISEFASEQFFFQ